MRVFSSAVICILSIALSAQQKQTAEQPQKKHFVFEKVKTVNFEAISQDYSPKLMFREMPRPAGEKMEHYNYGENKHAGAQNYNVILPALIKNQSFQANIWGFSTPNDNDFAISDSGMAVSVINTNIFLRNTSTGYTNVKSLAAFTASINNLHQEFDPKVMYDPKKDRFVMLCLVGFVDSTSKIIVGFSQTNDPFGSWHLYAIPGNPFNNNLWSDYPMIAMTEKELFLTVNLLVNNQPWQTAFVETIVWQMKKDNGYQGLPLGSVLHSNIQYNGKSIRNLCPVKGGSQLFGPNMYFLSNRNMASQNDTVFLVNITDTIAAPGQTVTVKCLTTPLPYYFPPDGRQTNSVQTLATNDCRNLGAFLQNNKIQYVLNTKNPGNNLATVYYGVLNNPQAPTPTITGYYIQNDTVDFAYPNISYAGNGPGDDNAIISFDHSSDKIFAGVSAIRADGLGDFSPVLRIQNGNTYVNLLQSNLERWGDYTGSQRKYNNPGEVWMSGFRATYHNINYPYAHSAWVTQLALSNGVLTGVKNSAPAEESASVFPNPFQDHFMVDLELSSPEYLSFELYDVQGKQIAILLRDWVKTSTNTFSFRTADLPKGVYILKISGSKTRISKKLIID